MAHARAVGVWILLTCSYQLLYIVEGQFLSTTCPKVAPAKCPGMCASGAQQESGQCSGNRKLAAAAADAEGITASSSSSSAVGSHPRTPAAPSASPSDPATAATSAGQQPDAAAAPEDQQQWWQMQQQPAENGAVPQRVKPLGSGDEPVESNQQQRDIIQHLQALYNADPEVQSLVVNGTNNTAPAVAPADSAVPSANIDRPRVAAAVSRSGPYNGPNSQVQRNLTFLGNGKIKIGLDMQRAGVISWLSSPLIPAPWRNANLVNTWDQGRLLQQSFYGCVDGSCWATRPWLWNPVQGGSWENTPGVTTKQVITPGKRIYIEGNPRNWGKQDLIKQVLLISDITLADNYVISKFSMRYSGSVTHPYMTQEVPAVFVDRRFSVLAYYDSTKPWTGDKNIAYAFPPGRNVYARPTEFWAAFIDPTTGWGVGVFNPMAWMGITAYRVGADGSDLPWDCSYFAHTIRMQLHPGMKPYNYTAYITVGTLSSIRATFYKLRSTPGVMPVSKSGPGAEGDAPGTAPDQAGQDISSGQAAASGQPDLGRNAWYGSSVNYSAFDNVIVDKVAVQDSEQQGVSAAATAAAAAVAAANAPSEGSASQVNASGQQSSRAAAAQGVGTAGEGEGGGVGRGAVVGVVVAAVAGCALLAGIGLATRKKRLQGASPPSNAGSDEAQAADTAPWSAEAAAAAAAAAGKGDVGSTAGGRVLVECVGEGELLPATGAAAVAADAATTPSRTSSAHATGAGGAVRTNPGVTTRSAAALARDGQTAAECTSLVP